MWNKMILSLMNTVIKYYMLQLHLTFKLSSFTVKWT